MPGHKFRHLFGMIEEKSNELNILFYCKDCQRVVVDPPKHPKKYEYKCPICNGEKVVFGTKNAITEFFHIKDAMLEKMLDNPNEK